MSTDMQRYSLENQSDAIAIYAARHGLTIVRSYEDAGRSGLRIGRRNALQSLLNDVKSGRADFEAVLVYDVSRWGRFQDTDESAYYEFICKQAGVRVQYCAEEFDNDGSLTATVLKNIKRAMAGEYSRELSTKVFAGQSRIVSMGFHGGSIPGYGLRRYLVDGDGNPKMELAFGERKSIQTERVILVPGPIEEINVVRRVYGLFIDQNKTMKDIAAQLNARGIPNGSGRRWSILSVRDLLSNEKYIGNSVYNRTSKKLGINWRRNPSEEWVRSVGAFEPIISFERFQQAQRRLQFIARRDRYAENDMLDALTALWCRAGRLTNTIVEGARHCPATNTYKKRFNSLANAYLRIGYRATRRTGRNLNLRKALCQEIVREVSLRGGSVEMLPGSCQMLVNREIAATVVVGRTPPASKVNLWQFGYRSGRRPDVLIVARLDGAGGILDYFMLPFAFLARGSWITVSGRNYRRLEAFRSVTLAPFYDLCARVPLRGA